MKLSISRLLVIIVALLTGIAAMAQDIVILRSGDELEGRVLQASQSTVTIETKKGGLFSKELAKTSLKPSDIYMIKYKERGNLYFKEDGKRVSGEKQKLDRTADIVYLCDGKEIQAWDLSLNPENITFRTTKDQKRAQSSVMTLSNSAVFMIKYSDGSRDVVNDITINPEPQQAASAETVTDPEPQIKVVFHTVKAGDTLASIAKEYGVRVEDIREWNEISTATKENTRLKAGVQYMIQQTLKK